jgi:hypothetical protein
MLTPSLTMSSTTNNYSSQRETKPRDEASANVTFYFDEISPRQGSPMIQTSEMTTRD